MARQDSNDDRKWKDVHETCKGSIFFVMVKPKTDGKEAIKSFVRGAEILPVNVTDAEMFENRTATAFVVGESPEAIKLLTCAHLLDHVYRSGKPILPEEANNLFSVSVFCHHAEIDYLDALTKKRLVGRKYGTGKFATISCSLDLLTISVPKSSISYLVDNIKGSKQVCCAQHPVIPPSIIPSAPLDRALMLSWPADMHETVAKSFTCHGHRTIKSMPGDNPHGYAMRLLQIGVLSNKGCSGSPLLDDNGRFLAMLHGGDTVWSYFISLEDITDFLKIREGGSGTTICTAKRTIKMMW